MTTKKKWLKPLSKSQAYALQAIHEQEGLVRGPAWAPGYWQWRWFRRGTVSTVQGITVESLVKRGLLQITQGVLGVDICRLTPAGQEIQKQNLIRK